MGLHFSVFKSDNYLVHTLQTGLYKENCYVVICADNRDAVIIDPGAEANYLIDEIDTLDVNITMILLTHGHFDHLGAADCLANHYDVEVYAHQLEKKLIRQAGIYAYRFGKEKLLPPLKITYYEGYKDINWSGGPIKIKPCPGHTAGCVSYVFDAEIAFTGDTLFRGFIGPSNYPSSDYHKLLKSVDALLLDLPYDCIIFPGHGKHWVVRDAVQWWKSVSADPPQFYLFGDSKFGR